uniref:ATP-grasp domain-containing protein n=1 Tax=Rhodopseudomonas palustris (strain BisA53) TaxID=316055 RepID=Q07UA3_RHOP5
MAPSPSPTQPLRVLLSEAGSTSAREAITLLGLAGHHVEICDPSPRCLGRLSRFVRAFHRCPGLGVDPAGYLAFVEDLLERRHFDVLLPIHEQGLLFAKVQPRLAARTGVALPAFESYRTALDKARFSALLDQLELRQPPTTIVTSIEDARTASLPCVVKAAIGTASRGVWIVRSAAERDAALRELADITPPGGAILLQEFVEGPVEHAQAVFCRGELLAIHGYRRIAEGAGGGPAQKLSVRRDGVRADVAKLGRHLAWHGALSLDYIWSDDTPRYIDCNPRLVEPMSAALAGTDLLGLLLLVSRGEKPPLPPASREGVRSHLAMQALLGCALRQRSRRALLGEIVAMLGRRGPYVGSVEELTPLRADWLGFIPLLATALILMARPGLAQRLTLKGWGDHLLDAAAVRAIDNDIR